VHDESLSGNSKVVFAGTKLVIVTVPPGILMLLARALHLVEKEPEVCLTLWAFARERRLKRIPGVTATILGNDRQYK
jgi:hypothetical protein